MKLQYEKPIIKKVKLVPSEAVLQACKTTNYIGGPRAIGCVDLEQLTCLTHGS